MVRQSIRTYYILTVIIFFIFIIITSSSMVDGKNHASQRHKRQQQQHHHEQQQQHQCSNNHESHHRCPPNTKHSSAAMKRKKRYDSTTTISPNNHFENKKNYFDHFYDNLKFDLADSNNNNNDVSPRQINAGNTKENYLKDLEKLFGPYSEQNLENQKDQSNPEENSPPHIRVKRGNGKTNQASSEYFQNLADSFADSPENQEENSDSESKQNESANRKLKKHHSDISKRDIENYTSLENRLLDLIRHKRFGDPEKMKCKDKMKNRKKKSYVQNKNNLKNIKNGFNGKIKMNVDKRNIKKPQNKKKSMSDSDKKKNQKHNMEKKSLMEKKGSNKLTDLTNGNNRQEKIVKSKRSLKGPQVDGKKMSKGYKRSPSERLTRPGEANNDLDLGSKTSSSLGEIKSLAENLIFKIDRLEESMEIQRSGRHTRHVPNHK